MSKKTLKSERAKTKSAHKRKLSIAFSLLFIVVGIVAWVDLKPNKTEEGARSAEACLQIEEKCFELEVADTDKARMKGLSGRDNLAENQGMLFSFERAEEQCFWMKDMRFNIDIIWADEQKKIIKVEKDVPPDTYPELFCAKGTKYVLEFSSGFVSKHGLKAGTTLQFE
jgi:hypothetical protein